MKYTIPGHIIGNNLKLDQKLFKWAMQELAYKDGKGTPVIVEIERADKRSQLQHKFYWVYLGVISKETGHTPDELHEYFKDRYLEATECLVMGKVIKIAPSTKNLTKAAYSDYMAKIEEETGVPIPDTQGYYENLLNDLCDN